MDAHRKALQGLSPCAKGHIGLWRTATTGTARRTGTPVRLFGGPRGRLASILDSLVN